MGNVRNIAFWVVLFLLILALFNLFNNSQATVSSNTRSYSDFVTAVESGSVAEVTLDGEQIRYRGTDNSNYVSIKPEDAAVSDLLISKGIRFMK